MKDGRLLTLDLRENMSMPYLLTGDIWEESGETEFVGQVVKKGNVVLDIGANIGWYTSLFSELVGPEGRVIAFEPGPRAFPLVAATAEQYPQCEVHQLALSDITGTVEFYLADDAAQSSLRKPYENATPHKCDVTRLDLFLEMNGVRNVDLIKCDAEGAELSIVNGAADLIASERPPIWMLEINAPMMEKFGAAPQQLFDRFGELKDHSYEFYRINSQTGFLDPLPPEFSFRFDAVIVPAARLDVIAEYRRYKESGASYQS
jgi:FkbM family methyltransferase